MCVFVCFMFDLASDSINSFRENDKTADFSKFALVSKINSMLLDSMCSFL